MTDPIEAPSPRRSPRKAMGDCGWKHDTLPQLPDRISDDPRPVVGLSRRPVVFVLKNYGFQEAKLTTAMSSEDSVSAKRNADASAWFKPGTCFAFLSIKLIFRPCALSRLRAAPRPFLPLALPCKSLQRWSCDCLSFCCWERRKVVLPVCVTSIASPLHATCAPRPLAASPPKLPPCP